MGNMNMFGTKKEYENDPLTMQNQSNLRNHKIALSNIYSTANRAKLALMADRIAVETTDSDDVDRKNQLLAGIDHEIENMTALMKDVEKNHWQSGKILDELEENLHSPEAQKYIDELNGYAGDASVREEKFKEQYKDAWNNIINKLQTPIKNFLNNEELVNLINQMNVLLMDIEFGVEKLEVNVEAVSKAESDEPDYQKELIGECNQAIANLNEIGKLISNEITIYKNAINSDNDIDLGEVRYAEIHEIIQQGKQKRDNFAETINHAFEQFNTVDRHVKVFQASPEKREEILAESFQTFADLYMDRRDQADEMISVLRGYIEEIESLPDKGEDTKNIISEYSRMINELEDERDWSESYIDYIKGEL